MKCSKIKGNDVHNNMETSQNNQAEWMKPDKSHSSCSMFPWMPNSRSHKLVYNDRGHQWLGVESTERSRGTSGDDGNSQSWW